MLSPCFLIHPQSLQKQKDLALRDPPGKLWKNCRAAARPLMHSRHTGHMDPKTPTRSVWIFLAIFLALAWAAIVFLAVMVTETVVGKSVV